MIDAHSAATDANPADASQSAAETPSPPQSHSAPPLEHSIEAILLTSERPITARRLAEGLGLVAPETTAEATPNDSPEPRPRRKAKAGSGDPLQPVIEAIDRLNAIYAETGRTFRIEPVAGGYRLMTIPAMAGTLAAFHRTRISGKLSRAAVEALAVIAYKQPITRAHLEAIRGVNCGEVLRSLVERRLVTITGRAEELGRPILYGTTKEFLDAFGLSSLKDLPSAADLQGIA